MGLTPVIVDGGKGLRAAVRKAFRHRALVQRCQWHKRENVVREPRGCFRHQLLLPRLYLVLTKPLRLDIQCQRGASVKICWKYLDD